MKQRFGYFLAACAMAVLMFAAAAGARAQVTVAAGYTPPDDTPKVNVGGTIFADYTYQQEPTVKGSDGDQTHPAGFNITRAYINVTGQINHLIYFRITPDIVRVGSSATGGAVSGLTNTYTYRLKYAYGQLNFSDFTTNGSWFRFGLQQTPWIDFEEGIYRYRFAGTIFSDREGALTSSDAGATVHWNIPGDFGDIHGGVYNGNGYSNLQDSDSQMSLPGPRNDSPASQGADHQGAAPVGLLRRRPLRDRTRRRSAISAPSRSRIRTSTSASSTTSSRIRPRPPRTVVEAHAYSVWATPRTCFGLEALLRWDRITPDTTKTANRQRLIAGPAYWFPVTKSGVAAAVMLRWEQLRYMGAPNSKPTEESIGLFTLFNF